MEPQTQFDIVKGVGSDEELEKYRQCFIFNGSEKSLDNLKWMHQQNLRGSNSIYYGIDRETHDIAGIHTYLPVILRCMGKIVNGMQSFDTLTDKRHRSKGLFIKLALTVVKEESVNNELVYAFPNENSVYGYVNKLGFNYFGEVPFLIKPFRVYYFIKKILKRRETGIPDSNCNILILHRPRLKGRFEIKEISKFDEKYDELYNTVTPQINIGINRNAAYMNWRYIAKPGEIYARFGLYEDNQLTGVIVFTLKNKHGGKIGYLMELLYDPKNEKAGTYLLKFCSGTLKKNNADLILAWCFDHSFNYTCIRRNGYYKFPEKFRPQKLNFITKTLHSKNIKDIYNIKNWYISYSDSDTV